MRRPPTNSIRPGALALEAAIVLPAFIVLLLGIAVGGVAVFRYQQTACLAREASRWACVRGADYQRATDLASPTSQDIYNQVIVPRAIGMDLNSLTAAIEIIDRASNQTTGWDASGKDIKSITSLGEYVTNYVRVTVTYTWSPGVIFPPMTFRSVSEVPMSS